MPLPPALNLKGMLDARLEYCRDCVYREFRMWGILSIELFSRQDFAISDR